MGERAFAAEISGFNVFLALSQAPPPEVIEIATKIPVTMLPTKTPPKTLAASLGKRKQSKGEWPPESSPARS